MYHQSLRHTCGQTMHHHRTADERDARAALHIPPPSQQHALCIGNDERNMHVLSEQKLCGLPISSTRPAAMLCSADAGPCLRLTQHALHPRSQLLGRDQSISMAWSAVSRRAVDAIDGLRSWYAVADDHRACTHSPPTTLHEPFPATHHRGQTRLARLIAICIVAISTSSGHPACPSYARG